jgi:hypothetical protein
LVGGGQGTCAAAVKETSHISSISLIGRRSEPRLIRYLELPPRQATKLHFISDQHRKRRKYKRNEKKTERTIESRGRKVRMSK